MAKCCACAKFGTVDSFTRPKFGIATYDPSAYPMIQRRIAPGWSQPISPHMPAATMLPQTTQSAKQTGKGVWYRAARLSAQPSFRPTYMNARDAKKKAIRCHRGFTSEVHSGNDEGHDR